MKRLTTLILVGLLPWLAGAQTLPLTDGLKVWLKADAIAGVVHGQVVTNWPDAATVFISGDGAQNATLAAGGVGMAVYVTNAINLKPAVSFSNAALAYFGSLGLNTNEGGQAFTVFVVGNNNKTAISPAFSFGDVVNGVSDGKGGAGVKCDVSTGTNGNNDGAGLRWNDGRRLFSGGNFSTNQFHVGFWRMDVGTVYSNAVYRLDNMTYAETGLSGGDQTINLLDEGYYVGGSINGSTKLLSETLNGQVAEILFYNRALSDQEANQVGYYLEQKYGLNTAYAPPATNNLPNIVVVLIDDMGFSDLGCYGGEARTPNIDSLAAGGLRFRNFHNTARCSPTRMALLAGLYTQQAATVPGDSLPPMRTDNNITIAEVLGTAGYRTFMGGKWHLGTTTEQLPRSRGFQHVFGTGSNQAGSGADHWIASAYSFYSTSNAIPSRTYGTNAYDFYGSDAVGDYALDFLDYHFNRADHGSFFMYLPFNSPHFDIQADKALAENTPAGGQSYLSNYTQGWDIVRSNRYQRMLAQGVINSNFALAPFSDTPGNGTPEYAPVPAWSSLGANRKADLARRMALYAAMIEKIDQDVGRVVDRLRAGGQLDNTLIFLLADNGCNAEGGMYGWARAGTEVNKNNNHAALTGTNLTEMGQPFRNDSISIGGGWANVGNTPFRMYKHYTHEGGTQTPLVVHWPAGITNAGRWTEQRGHVIDLMRTIVEVTGATYPTQFNGHAVLPMEGRSLAPIFLQQPEFDRTIGFEHEANRAWLDGHWKLVTKNFASTDGSSMADTLELYDMSVDPTELTNLALVYPSRLLAMVQAWDDWAVRVGVDADRLLPSPFNPTPATNGPDLFLDTFTRPDAWDVDASAAGMSGSRVPPLGANAAYYEGFEGSGSPDSIYLLTGRLRFAFGSGMSENGLMHNFVGQDILDAGGFSVSLQINAINSTTNDPPNHYVGFGVGLTQTEAAAGGDIGGTKSFRGSVANPVGKADFFVELNYDGAVQIWSKGQLLETLPVGATNGTLTASFALNGFSTTSPVTVNVFFNRNLLDINTADANSSSRTFTWENADANYIGLSARANGYAEVDNLAIRKLPLAAGLAAEYALNAGLTVPDSALTADPDGDGDNNLQEWLKGGKPALPDRGRQLLAVAPSPTGEFRFRYYSLQNAAPAGVAYTFRCSTNLKDWTPFTPEELARQVDQPGYELVQGRVPAVLGAGQRALFVLLETSGPTP